MYCLHTFFCFDFVLYSVQERWAYLVFSACTYNQISLLLTNKASVLFFISKDVLGPEIKVGSVNQKLLCPIQFQTWKREHVIHTTTLWRLDFSFPHCATFYHPLCRPYGQWLMFKLICDCLLHELPDWLKCTLLEMVRSHFYVLSRQFFLSSFHL